MDWPWTRRDPPPDDVRRLRQEVEDLRSDLKRIRAEWEDMFERLCRRDDRIRKRQERETAPDQGSLPLVSRKMALRARVAARGGSNGQP
jgi:hypothetical protein